MLHQLASCLFLVCVSTLLAYSVACPLPLWGLAIVQVAKYYFLMFRLLDVQCSDGRFEHELVVYMVFEYMDQDLDQFIHQSRLDSRLTKVPFDYVMYVCGDAKLY